MHIPLDRESDIPLYQQIEDCLRQRILAGSLAPDTRLPATRQLAEDLCVSRITVKNAYDTLESDGLIGSREGSGTYVLSSGVLPVFTKNDAGVVWPLWQQEALGADLPQDANPDLPCHPDTISFTGVGDPREFPLDDFAKAIRDVLRRDGTTALGYGDFNHGYAPLRETIAHVLASQGILAHPDNILITSGSQQALSIVCQVLLKAGDVVLVEKPTYNFALDLFRSLHLKIVGIPVDENGLRIDLVEALLQKHHPKLIYTIPNFQNPTGVCLSGTRRCQLITLADRYNVPILEDDFSGDLRFEGCALQPIKAIDPGGRVIYVGTFSKMLMPGLRVGYLLVDGPIFKRLVDTKRFSDLTTSPLLQRTLNEYVTIGRYQTHIRRSCQIFRKRRDAAVAAIKKYLPPEISFKPPHGGLFIWLRLPENVSSLDLLPFALAEGVEFTPGGRFFPVQSEGERYLRLNFATQTPQEITTGIQRLAAALSRMLSKSA
jgi:GntR family transcriptional regulator / MocR family aminotransferase